MYRTSDSIIVYSHGHPRQEWNNPSNIRRSLGHPAYNLMNYNNIPTGRPTYKSFRPQNGGGSLWRQAWYEGAEERRPRRQEYIRPKSSFQEKVATCVLFLVSFAIVTAVLVGLALGLTRSYGDDTRAVVRGLDGDKENTDSEVFTNPTTATTRLPAFPGGVGRAENTNPEVVRPEGLLPSGGFKGSGRQPVRPPKKPDSDTSDNKTDIASATTAEPVQESCNACEDLPSVPPGYTEIFYDNSEEYVVNPSRGFCQLVNARASSFSPLTVSYLDRLREEEGNGQIWRQYILDLFVESDISQEFLQNIRDDLDTILQAKYTAVIRFMYTDQFREQAPYGDATKEWILRHIDQLRPVFFDYEGVIDVLQAGFIGIWGEWYYTTYFGDPNDFDCGDPDNVRCMTPENWQDRRDVLNALLDSTPSSVHVQVRVPQYKYEIVQDLTPTSEEEMKQRTHKARIGHHNDCFLASSTDYGTYVDKTFEYPYLSDDTKYTAMGGETCGLSVDEPYDRYMCPTALEEMTMFHWTYMNQIYHPDVLQSWKDDGCFNDIHRQFGYRLSLIKAILPRDIPLRGQFCLYIELQNLGFAAPFKTTNAAIVLRHTLSGNLYEAVLSGVDVRTWLPGEPIIIDTTVFLTEDIVPGLYQVLFMIKHDQLHTVSDYNILVANTAVPEHQSGFNSLLHEVTVLDIPDDEDNDGCPEMVPLEEPERSPYDRVYCGLGGCAGRGPCQPFHLQNPSFETETSDSWQKYADGFEYTQTDASHGGHSIKITNGGAYQKWTFPPNTKAFQVTADSKGVNITGSASEDYSIFCDIEFLDGSWLYSNTAIFTVGTTDWQTITFIANLKKNIAGAWCYAMFRNYNAGTAYFDNFNVWTSDSAIETACKSPAGKKDI